MRIAAMFFLMFVFGAAFAPQSQAAQCYWTSCSKSCKSGYGTSGLREKDKQFNCLRKQCCKKDEEEEARNCRGKCGKKGNAYGGYFQCMDKCLGRKR